MYYVRVEKYRRPHGFLLYFLRFGLDYGLLHGPQPNKDYAAIGSGNPCEHIHVYIHSILYTAVNIVLRSVFDKVDRRYKPRFRRSSSEPAYVEKRKGQEAALGSVAVKTITAATVLYGCAFASPSPH